MVVGGTVADWTDLTDEAWRARAGSYATAVAEAGGRWLTLRPFARGDADVDRPVSQSVVRLAGCTVVVDPSPDGRERLVVALRKAVDQGDLAERSIASALFAPAEVEPDLVVVLGPSDRLPPSLVWELAYSELVYLDVAWADLDVEHLRAAIGEFAGRHRRFGGLD
jgi:undecaprenyl diphosphate synthase